VTPGYGPGTEPGAVVVVAPGRVVVVAPGWGAPVAGVTPLVVVTPPLPEWLVVAVSPPARTVVEVA
jgi:hypothetical protein